jgi:hypothetical protein
MHDFDTFAKWFLLSSIPRKPLMLTNGANYSAGMPVPPQTAFECFQTSVTQDPNLQSRLHDDMAYLQSYDLTSGTGQEIQFISAMKNIGNALGGNYWETLINAYFAPIYHAYLGSVFKDDRKASINLILTMCTYLQDEAQSKIFRDVRFFKSYNFNEGDCQEPTFVAHMNHLLQQIGQAPIIIPSIGVFLAEFVVDLSKLCPPRADSEGIKDQAIATVQDSFDKFVKSLAQKPALKKRINEEHPFILSYDLVNGTGQEPEFIALMQMIGDTLRGQFWAAQIKSAFLTIQLDVDNSEGNTMYECDPTGDLNSVLAMASYLSEKDSIRISEDIKYFKSYPSSTGTYQEPEFVIHMNHMLSELKVFPIQIDNAA